ncbi:MAG: TRAM domain-containing protein [Sphaerochaetaceae bacterium]|nr:TRAM domain-containing protein [Sphaerochaetaceae bacterium]
MEIKVESIVQNGLGLARKPDGKVVFIDKVLPGEIVDIKITKEKKDYDNAVCTRIIVPSPSRITPICPYYGICGGCNLMHLDYKAQVAYKKDIIQDTFNHFKIDVEDIEESVESSPFGYRTRVRFKCGKSELGFSKADSRDFVSISNCPVLDKSLNDFNPKLKKYENKGFVSAFLSDDGPVYDDNFHPVTVLDKILFVSNSVFFQSNLSLLGQMISYVKSRVIGPKVMDLYCGIGTFSAFLEDDFEVTAIEQNTFCLQLARKHLKNTNFYTAKVEDYNFNGKFDTIIVDPPRIGLDKKVPLLIKRVNPKRIIYVSCDVVTLSRDLSTLQSLNYSVKSVKLFDLYPQTYHLETVTILDKG